MTWKYQRQKKAIKILHNFTDNVIIARRTELLKAQESKQPEAKADDEIGAKKRLAFLDVLLQSTIDGEALSNRDIREEVDTIMFEGLKDALMAWEKDPNKFIIRRSRHNNERHFIHSLLPWQVSADSAKSLR